MVCFSRAYPSDNAFQNSTCSVTLLGSFAWDGEGGLDLDGDDGLDRLVGVRGLLEELLL